MALRSDSALPTLRPEAEGGLFRGQAVKKAFPNKEDGRLNIF